jgi:hypothetical protein
LVTAAVVLLLVGAIVVVALVQPAGDVEHASGAPATSATGAGGAVLRTGTVRMTVAVGQPEEALDLDAGVKGTASAFVGTELPDVAAAVLGLTGLNGARFSSWTLPAAPSPAACAAIPAAEWSSSVLLAALVPNAVNCVRTSDERFAALTVQAVDAVGGAEVFSASLTFTVWKKPGD